MAGESSVLVFNGAVLKGMLDCIAVCEIEPGSLPVLEVVSSTNLVDVVKGTVSVADVNVEVS